MFRIRLKYKPSKKILVIAGCTVLTLANAGGLGYAINRHSKQVVEVPIISLPEVVTPKVEITNVKKREPDVTLQGKKLGTGTYKTEVLKKSRITAGNPAKLAIASHEQSGGHFVLAFLNKGNIPTHEQLEQGWDLHTIAEDPMWAPGACSSKPTFLLQDKYVFIDDGKTSPDDKYNSYIVFNMQTAEYVYVGGNNFTETQALKERILLAANENDKLVFYIDPVDDQPYTQEGSAPGHTRGKDHAYIIRREVDPSTFDYTDYSLPFTVPKDITNYYLYAFSNSMGVGFTINSPYINGVSGPYYEGSLKDNVIHFATPGASNYSYVPQLDSPLEVSIDGLLNKSLSALTAQKPYDGSQYKTMFTATELGSYHGLQFLNVSQRYGQKTTGVDYLQYYSTPLIYDKDSSKIFPMVTKAVMRNGVDYVNLGIF